MWYKLLLRKITRQPIDDTMLISIETMHEAHQLTDEEYQNLIQLIMDDKEEDD